MKCKCACNLRQIATAIRMYSHDNKDRYPCAKDPIMANPDTSIAFPIWLWMGRGWRPFVEPYLGGNSGKNIGSNLLCPQDVTDPNKYDDTSYGYSLCFYHSPAQINTITTIQQQLYENYILPSIPQQTSSVRTPARKILIGEWLSNHLPVQGNDGGWWCHKGSRNFLFADSHIEFIEAEKMQLANDGYPNPNVTKDGVRGFDWPR